MATVEPDFGCLQDCGRLSGDTKIIRTLSALMERLALLDQWRIRILLMRCSRRSRGDCQVWLRTPVGILPAAAEAHSPPLRWRHSSRAAAVPRTVVDHSQWPHK